MLKRILELRRRWRIRRYLRSASKMMMTVLSPPNRPWFTLNAVYEEIDNLIPRERPLVRVRCHFVMHDAVPMTKDEIIYRREEALLIFQEGQRREWCIRLAMINHHSLSSAKYRANIVAAGRQLGKQYITQEMFDHLFGRDRQ